MKASLALLLSLLVGPAWAGGGDYAPGMPTAGQLPGTNTNSSACAGCVGEYITNTDTGTSATVTITIASPGVISSTAHGFMALSPVYFSTSGALPTGINAFTPYYVTAGASLQPNSFQISTTVALAQAGTSVITTGSQSGVQTSHAGVVMTSGSNIDVMAMQLNGGDYDCQGLVFMNYGGATSVTAMNVWLSTAGASTLPNSNQTAIATAALIDTLASATVQPAATLITGTLRVSLASPGMIVLASNDTYTVSSVNVGSSLRCRRTR